MININPNNSSSYSGGASLNNLGSVGGRATINGQYDTVVIQGKRAIHLINTFNAPWDNRSYLTLPRADVHTISIWFYMTSVGYTQTVWLLQAIDSPGDESTGLLTWGYGSIWNGSCYLNGGSALSINPNVFTPFLNPSASWQHMTIVAKAKQVSSLYNMFAKSTGQEAMDVNVGMILVYNRALSEAENNANYRAGF